MAKETRKYWQMQCDGNVGMPPFPFYTVHAEPDGRWTVRTPKGHGLTNATGSRVRFFKTLASAKGAATKANARYQQACSLESRVI